MNFFKKTQKNRFFFYEPSKKVTFWPELCFEKKSPFLESLQKHVDFMLSRWTFEPWRLLTLLCSTINGILKSRISVFWYKSQIFEKRLLWIPYGQHSGLRQNLECFQKALYGPFSLNRPLFNKGFCLLTFRYQNTPKIWVWI